MTRASRAACLAAGLFARRGSVRECRQGAPGKGKLGRGGSFEGRYRDQRQRDTEHALDPRRRQALDLAGRNQIGDEHQRRRIHGSDPNDADAYRRRARAYWYKGEYAKAIADADKAIGLDPNNSGNRSLI